MAVLGGSGVGIMDLNDALISNGIPPRDPVAGALWIDTSTGTSVLKVYINNKWETQKLDVSKLDPDLATKLQGVIDTLGTIANDGVLTFSDRVTLSKELGEILGVLPSKSTGNVYPSALPDYTVLDASGSGTFANMRLRATDVGIGTDTAWYKDVETAYKALNTFLSTFTPKPWDITTANKAVNVTIATPDIFRQRFLDYYMAELRLATETEKQAKIKAEQYTEKLTDGSSVLDKAVVSGNPIFTDKSDDAVVHVEVDGKSEQIVIEGNQNLLSLTSLSSSRYPNVANNGLTSWKFTGEPNTDYTLSTNVPIGAGRTTYDVFFARYPSTPSSVTNGVALNTPRTVTTNASGVLEVSFRSSAVGSQYVNINAIINGTYWVKLEKSSIATPIPTPSPDFPSTIKSTFDWRRENIFLANKVVASKMASTTSEGLEAFTNSDVDGIFYPIQGELNKQYTLTFKYKHTQGTNPMYLKFYYSDGTDDGTGQGALDATVLSTKSITSAVNKTVIGIGYKDYNDSIVWKSVTTYVAVPFTTVRQNDATQLLGTEVVKTQGVNGRIEVVTEHEYINNVVSGNKREISRVTETTMVPKVILVGTKQPDDVIEWRPVTTYEAISITTNRQNDSTIALGTEVVQTQGTNGRIKIITEFKYVNSVASGESREISRATETAMVPKVILVGTKQPDIVEWRPITSYETISFTTSRQNDSTSIFGTEFVKTQGVNGSIKVVTEHEYVNSVETGNKREISRVTETTMVPKVILVGTKKLADVTFNFTVTE